MNTRGDTRVLDIRGQRFIVYVDLLDILRLSHQSLESVVFSNQQSQLSTGCGAYDSGNVKVDRQIGSLERESRIILVSLVQRWLEKAITGIGDSDCLLREVEGRGICYRDWTTDNYQNVWDLSICFGESVKKKLSTES